MSNKRRSKLFTQRRYPVVYGGRKEVTLLRLPEDDAGSLPSPDVPTYFYREEIKIPEDAAENHKEGKDKTEGLQQPADDIKPSLEIKTDTDPTSKLRRLETYSLQSKRDKKRPRYPKAINQWVLEAEDWKLYGAPGTSSISAAARRHSGCETASSYFLMKIDEGKNQTQLVPVKELLLMKQRMNVEGSFEDPIALDFIKHGYKAMQRSKWAACYGKHIVDLLAPTDVVAEDESHQCGPPRKPAWHRSFRPDDEEARGEDDFNPASKVAPSYNDVFDVMLDGREGEVLGMVFQEVDMGADELPDAAEEGFGAPEWGDETLPEAQRLPVEKEAEDTQTLLSGSGGNSTGTSDAESVSEAELQEDSACGDEDLLRQAEEERGKRPLDRRRGSKRQRGFGGDADDDADDEAGSEGSESEGG